MPNQIPFNYYQNTPIPNFQDLNQTNIKTNESNIIYKLNELEQRINILETKINELIQNKNNNNYDYNYKTSMHMM